jgi:hypothetical protein
MTGLSFSTEVFLDLAAGFFLGVGFDFFAIQAKVRNMRESEPGTNKHSGLTRFQPQLRSGGTILHTVNGIENRFHI